MDNFGIQETKEAALCGIKIGMAIGSSLDDGKFTLSDAPKFVGAMMSLPAAISNASAIPQELAHLTEDEKIELLASIGEELKIDDEKIEGIVLDGLKIVSQIHTYVTTYFIKTA